MNADGTTRVRLALANAALVGLLFWPAAQHVVTRTFDMNPWAFFGFAMYTVPNLRTNVRVGVYDPAGSEAPDWNATPRSVRGLIHPYTARRASWGELLPPDALAAEVFARESSIPGVAVRVRTWALERESARIVRRDADYTYPRPGSTALDAGEP